ncbi:MAG TPA: methionine--tRNA ligase [Candidatus Sulfotelmatobacter sp.]|nr:methionine--tRNA ligase [Candidatus Sulfotelmatobacter sp.]
MTNPKFYLTTPIYYANSRPHVGSAYTTIVCDVIARYKRMCGYDVAFVTGTDEHGVNIERAAEKLGVSPAELVDRNQKIFRDLWDLLGIHFPPQHFIRTTELRHVRAVQTLVRRTLERDRSREPSKKAIYKAKYEGRYCIYDNAYVSDTPEPADCPTCGRPAELVSEENYFFRLSAYQGQLLEHYRKYPEFVFPDFRFNEVKSFVEAGLRDISISRKSIKWGIPWPDDPEHVFYVWYDALTSYITAIGFGEGHGGEANPEFQKFWPADIHAMGKEIIRFHAVYWPAFLMAAGLPLPKQIVAHGWLLFEQEKMSKSKGNVAYAEPIVKVLGNDALRYYLLRETVFGHDGNFSRDALLTRYNADLANGLGNLASRVLTMIEKYCSGRIPPFHEILPHPELLVHPEARQLRDRRHEEIIALLNGFQFSEAIQAIWRIVAEANRFVTLQAPWKLAENAENAKLLESVLRLAAEELRVATVYAHSVIPEATQKIWEQLGLPGRVGDQRIDKLEWGALLPGIHIRKPEAVFPRVDKEEASERIAQMEEEIRNPSAPAPATSQESQVTGHGAPATDSKISIDDFAKVEMRVGIVKSAERIPGADKLLKVLVDIGDEVRQVLAGIAQYYAPESLIGRKVVVVVNLAPRKMRGLESNGMIVAASVGPEGRPVLATFTEDVPPGAKLK